jgi:predicted nucleic acid-binding protein
MGLAVIDASVAVKWFLDEPETQAALALQADFLEGRLSIRVPSLFPFEVLNALVFSRRFRNPELAEAARDIDRMDFVTLPLVGPFMERTVATALRSRVTIYHASYLALAEGLGRPLFTADNVLLRAAGRETRAVHIREYRSSA